MVRQWSCHCMIALSHAHDDACFCVHAGMCYTHARCHTHLFLLAAAPRLGLLWMVVMPASGPATVVQPHQHAVAPMRQA